MKSETFDRILACRYYNGESDPPAETNSMFWGYECDWVNGKYNNWEWERGEIERLGLSDWLYNNDGTDSDLKCLLFNRYCHWIGLYGQTDEFLRWYNDCYVAARLTNRQRRANERRPNLIAKCRYYKGESENPYDGTPDHMKWYYERCWVEQLADSYENAKPYRMELKNNFDDISEKYNVPLSLIGLFLNRYEHWACMGKVDIEAFRGWVLHEYLKSTY